MQILLLLVICKLVYITNPLELTSVIGIGLGAVGLCLVAIDSRIKRIQYIKNKLLM